MAWTCGWKLIFDPKVCTTATIPGRIFSPAAATIISRTLCQAARHRPPNNSRFRRKYGRSIFGTVNTHCAWPTGYTGFLSTASSPAERTEASLKAYEAWASGPTPPKSASMASAGSSGSTAARVRLRHEPMPISIDALDALAADDRNAVN